VCVVADKLASAGDLQTLIPTLSTELATLLVECATAVVQEPCGQRIVEVVDDVQVLDLDEYDSGPWLALPERPVTAVSAVLIGSTAVTDYRVQLRRGRLWRRAGWRGVVGCDDGPSTVTVTYTHGYPANHQRIQLARKAVLGLCRSAGNNPAGATQIRVDDYAEVYDAMTARLEASPALKESLRHQYGRPPGSARLVRP